MHFKNKEKALIYVEAGVKIWLITHNQKSNHRIAKAAAYSAQKRSQNKFYLFFA